MVHGGGRAGWPGIRGHGSRHVRRQGADPHARRAGRAWVAEKIRRRQVRGSLFACQPLRHARSQRRQAHLEKELDQQDLLAAFDALASTYFEGGRFYRAPNTSHDSAASSR